MVHVPWSEEEVSMMHDVNVSHLLCGVEETFLKTSRATTSHAQDNFAICTRWFAILYLFVLRPRTTMLSAMLSYAIVIMVLRQDLI